MRFRIRSEGGSKQKLSLSLYKWRYTNANIFIFHILIKMEIVDCMRKMGFFVVIVLPQISLVLTPLLCFSRNTEKWKLDPQQSR